MSDFVSSISAHPLTWPHNMRRHGPRKAASSFRSTLASALKNVRESLTRFGKDSGKPLTAIVISSNVTLGDNSPSDTGVAVWFIWDADQVCIAVDRYAKVQDNLQAIHHIIEARRTELRHGGLQIVKATFSGFKGLPAPKGDNVHWTERLKLTPDATRDQIRDQYRKLAKAAHPDNGGTAEDMAALTLAREAALQERGQAE